MSARATIRPLGRADLPALLAMMREMAEYQRMLDRFIATEAAMEQELFADQPHTHAAIAEKDGQPVGFCIWMFFFHTFRCERIMFVEDVFVREAERSTGVGFALFRHMAREAKTRDCTAMLWDVLDWNEPALGFYARLGARAPHFTTVNRELSGEAFLSLAAS